MNNFLVDKKNSKRKIREINLALVGMMGSGKTTVGKYLSLKLKRKFFDLDQEVSEAAGCSINEIFEKYGEKNFRNGENRILKKILKNENKIVLSVGGGAFIDQELRKIINNNCVSIWLDADFKTLHKRLKNNHQHRPMFKGHDFNNRLNELIAKRKEFYELAHHKIIVKNSLIPEIASKIIDKFNE